MTISLLLYLATFSGLFYFRRNYLFTLFQSNYFDTIVTFSEQLFLQSSCFFRGILLSKEPFRCSSYSNTQFFGAKPLLSSYFLRIESSLGQLLFGTPNFVAEELIRIKISAEELLFQSRYLCTASAFSEELHFRKRQFLRKQMFNITYFFRAATFIKIRYLLQLLSCQKSYFLTTYFFRRVTISQLRFLFTATLTIYQLVIKRAQYQLRTHKTVGFPFCVSSITESRIIDKVY